jgi:hypothetical protein
MQEQSLRSPFFHWLKSKAPGWICQDDSSGISVVLGAVSHETTPKTMDNPKARQDAFP